MSLRTFVAASFVGVNAYAAVAATLIVFVSAWLYIPVPLGAIVIAVYIGNVAFDKSVEQEEASNPYRRMP